MMKTVVKRGPMDSLLGKNLEELLSYPPKVLKLSTTSIVKAMDQEKDFEEQTKLLKEAKDAYDLLRESYEEKRDALEAQLAMAGNR
jgi:ABC-type transporter lipoprotein component MlaA